MVRVVIDKINYEISENSCLADVCYKAGVPFSCNSGVCGSCQITIVNGAENLNELNQEEKELGMDRIRRLGCQCRIIKSTVEITF